MSKQKAARANVATFCKTESIQMITSPSALDHPPPAETENRLSQLIEAKRHAIALIEDGQKKLVEADAALGQFVREQRRAMA